MDKVGTNDVLEAVITYAPTNLRNLQAFTPLHDDPLGFLVTPDEELKNGGGGSVRKSIAKEVRRADVLQTIFHPDILFQPLTRHEVNRHSIGDFVSTYVSRAYVAPAQEEFYAVMQELLLGEKEPASSATMPFYNRGGAAPTAFRLMTAYDDKMGPANDHTYFVGDVMLLDRARELLDGFKALSVQDMPDTDFLGDLSQARRIIENENGIVSIINEMYRPVVLTAPFYDGKHWNAPTIALLSPGDVVLSASGDVMYFLNKFNVHKYLDPHPVAGANRTFVYRDGDVCRATTVEGFSKNLKRIRFCGQRSIVYGS